MKAHKDLNNQPSKIYPPIVAKGSDESVISCPHSSITTTVSVSNPNVFAPIKRTPTTSEVSIN